MKSLRRAKRVLDWVLNGLVGVTFLGIAVLIITLVILRYVFNSSVPGGNELLRFAFIYTTFIGAAILVGRRENIAIHIVVKKFPDTIRRALDVLVHALIVALHIYLLVLSFRWISVTGNNLAEELKFSLRYIQIALPIGCGIASVYAVFNAIEAIFDPIPSKEPSE
ncbi:TRAP transporter small permease [Candidatus Bipolaricaulota bacterium]|nr:TRAP transporter small permease [Candidatus Bipolaricaulota bacterium]